MSERRSFAERLPSMLQFVRFGVYAQIVGIVVLSVTLFTLLPPVLIVCLPIGMGLIALGWLAWAWMFFKTL